MNKRLLPIQIVFAVIASLMLIPHAGAQIHTVTVTVKGMSCPFCAYGVEKKLKRVEGVKSITVNMHESTAVLSAKKDSSINISQVPEAVKESGFTPGKIVMIAMGTVKMDKRQKLLLYINYTEQSLSLVDIKGSIKKLLVSHAMTGKVVEIHGSLLEKSAGLFTLSPESVKEVIK